MFISNVHQWAKKCVEDPRWLAECLQRIGRFGGQHPNSNVLIHSLEVWWSLRFADPETQLWALYHDAHEVLSGDITRPFKNDLNRDREILCDAVLQEELGFCYFGDDVGLFDKECGDAEALMWADIAWAVRPDECVDKFVEQVTWLRGILRERSKRGQIHDARNTSRHQ